MIFLYDEIEMKNVQNDENLRELDSYERLIAALEKVKDNKKVLSTVSKFAKMLSIGTAKIKCYNWFVELYVLLHLLF